MADAGHCHSHNPVSAWVSDHVFQQLCLFFFFFLCAFLEIAGAKGEGASLFIAEVYSAGIL